MIANLKRALNVNSEGRTLVSEQPFHQFDIIPEVEKVLVNLVSLAEEKKACLQVHVTPMPVIIEANKYFIQPLLYKLLFKILDNSREGAVIDIHVMDCDDKCIVESIHKNAAVSRQVTSDYFKKYRITNTFHNASGQAEDILSVYRKLVTSMGGELAYSLQKERNNYFRLKFSRA